MSLLSGTKVVHYFFDNVENANFEVVRTVNIIRDKLHGVLHKNGAVAHWPISGPPRRIIVVLF